MDNQRISAEITFTPGYKDIVKVSIGGVLVAQIFKSNPALSIIGGEWAVYHFTGWMDEGKGQSIFYHDGPLHFETYEEAKNALISELTGGPPASPEIDL